MFPRRFFWFCDAVALTAAFALAYLTAPEIQTWTAPGGPLRFQWLERFSLPDPHVFGTFRPWNETIWILLLALGVGSVVLNASGADRPIQGQSRTRIVASACAAMLIALALTTLVLFTLRSPRWSRLLIYLFTLYGAVALAGYRLALRSYRMHRARSGRYAKRVAFIGEPPAVARAAEHFRLHGEPGEYEMAGFFTMPGSLDTQLEGMRHLGWVGQLGDVMVHEPIHDVVVMIGGERAPWLSDVVQQCDYFRVRVRIVPEALLATRRSELQLMFHADALALPEVVLTPPHFDSDALFAKRVIDVTVSGTLLLLLSPLFLLVAALIKLTTPHLPVLYRWSVIGYKGRPFVGYKFTTMDADADPRQNELLADRNEMTGPVFKIEKDPRVTKLGRVLRKFSINELPQLWSVFKGDMSLVGPRPAFPHELARYELWHKRKLCVRPGITCLWQIRGRNRINSFDDWVRMDLEYIDNWSIWLDLRILFRTLWAVAAGTGS